MKDGGLKYANIRIDEASTEKFPSMVIITKCPSRLSCILGKKYIDLKSAILAIDFANAESMIIKDSYTAVKEIKESGLIGIEEF